jgi:hypothetical protein
MRRIRRPSQAAALLCTNSEARGGPGEGGPPRSRGRSPLASKRSARRDLPRRVAQSNKETDISGFCPERWLLRNPLITSLPDIHDLIGTKKSALCEVTSASPITTRRPPVRLLSATCTWTYNALFGN